MTKKQAKAIILRGAAAELHNHIANGSGWLFHNAENEPYTKTEQKKITAALEELCDDLRRRAEKLGAP
jgi:hypothetical protein